MQKSNIPSTKTILNYFNKDNILCVNLNNKAYSYNRIMIDNLFVDYKVSRNIEETLMFLSRQKFNLIILDANDTSLLNFILDLEKNEINIAMIILSNKLPLDKIMKNIKLNIYDCFIKPVNVTQFISTLKNIYKDQLNEDYLSQSKIEYLLITDNDMINLSYIEANSS